jgi:hypothetical protein
MAKIIDRRGSDDFPSIGKTLSPFSATNKNLWNKYKGSLQMNGSILPDNIDTIKTLEQLKNALTEILIRFDKDANSQTRDDYRALMEFLVETNIHLYTYVHWHDNKSVLDNITQGIIDNSHAHNNKGILDGISQLDIDRWNSNSGGGGIEEAPIDGKIYGRKNGAWVEVTSGPAPEPVEIFDIVSTNPSPFNFPANIDETNNYDITIDSRIDEIPAVPVLVSKPSWVTLNIRQDYPENIYIVDVYVANNTTTSTRTGVINFAQTGSSETKSINIVQAGIPVVTYPNYWGVASMMPANEAQVKAATQGNTSGKNFTLITGITLKNFFIAIPSTLTIASIISETVGGGYPINITTSFINQRTFTHSNGVDYTIWGLERGNPYMNNTEFRITIN